jgi:predicted dehydrogenase
LSSATIRHLTNMIATTSHHRVSKEGPMSEIRIGVLGAARILREALVAPARDVEGVIVHAIAARDADRARGTAARFGIPRVHRSYEALLADADLDAVYVPLPSALHARWSAAALDAGKHVLVEKPFTSNLHAAEALAAHSGRHSDLILAEAYHTGHHPLMGELRAIVDAGEIGVVQRASATFSIPIISRSDIRWNFSLGGGGLLDVGYYPVRFLRELFGPAPKVVAARARMRGEIDRFLKTELDFDGVRGTVVSGISSARIGMGVQIVGDNGRLRVSWPYQPQHGARITIEHASERRRQTVERISTYALQLAAFRDAIRGSAPNRTDAAAAVAQLSTIEAIQHRAGMRPRPSASLDGQLH